MMKMLKSTFLVFPVIFLFGCAASLIKYQGSPVQSSIQPFGINPALDFFVNRTIPDTFKFRWRGETNGNLGFNSVVTTDSLVFVSDLSGRIYCFNKQSGKRVGYLRYKGSIQCAPLIYKNLLIFPLVRLNQNESNLIFYDFSKGTELYKIEIPGKIISLPLLMDDMVYCLTTNGNIIKTNMRGDVMWTKKLKAPNRSNLFHNKGKFIFGSDKGEIVFFDYRTGEESSRVKVANYPLGNISVKDDVIYTSDLSGIIYAIRDHNILWSFNSGSRVDGYLTSDDNAIYFGNYNGDIFCLSRYRGEQIWRKNYGGVISAAPLVGNNYIIFPNLDRKLLFIDKETGVLINEMKFEGRVRLTPVINDQFLFIGYDNYIVEAYDLP